MPNRYSALVCWAILTVMFVMIATSCSSQGDAVNTDFAPVDETKPTATPFPTSAPPLTPKPTATRYPTNVPVSQSGRAFTFTTSHYAIPTPSGDFIQDSLASLSSEPVVDPGIIPTPYPITKEWLENGINGISGQIAYDFDEIFYPDYTTFPLDIPSARLYVNRCSSGHVNDDTITTMCWADNNNMNDVYSAMLIFVEVDIWKGNGKGAIVFSIIGKSIDWASIQMCEISFYKYPAQILESLSCSRPEIGSARGVLQFHRAIIDNWYEQ